jgi:hypothetical protein
MFIPAGMLLCAAANQAVAQCPDPTAPTVTYAASGPELIAPQSWSVMAGGEVFVPCPAWVLSGVMSGGFKGYLPAVPTATFQLVGMAPHILMVMVEAECAAIVATQTGDGLWYFSETCGTREEITLWGAGDGPMQVFVGATEPEGCDAVLTLETFDH